LEKFGCGRDSGQTTDLLAPEIGFAGVISGKPLSGSLLFFAANAHGRPRHRFETRNADFFFTDSANAVGSVFNPLDSSLDCPKEFGVDLKQPQVHVYFVIITRLVHKVAVPGILHVFPMSFLARIYDGVAFLLKGDFKPLEFLFVHLNDLELKTGIINQNCGHVNLLSQHLRHYQNRAST